jgi:predicted amidohydrolase YtcJ
MGIKKQQLRRLVLCVAAISIAGCSIDAADTVFTNGAVYTVDADKTWAQAVAVSEGRIVYVGDDERAGKYIGSSTQVIDLGGRMLMPGFHDSHMHPMTAGTRFFRCQLRGLSWPTEVMRAIGECAQQLHEGEWLRGVDLDDALFVNGSLHRSMLDEVVPGHVVVITDYGGDFIWTDSSGLEIAGIDTDTPDPAKGRIVRDPATGEPTGVLIGPAGTGLYWSIPYPSVDRLREALRLASEMANSFGITSANEARIEAPHWQAYVEADAANDMTLRVQGSQTWDFERGMEQVAEMIERRNGAIGRRFRADAVKFFLDGDFDGETAALIEPYAGTPGDYGESRFKPGVVTEIAKQLDANGFQLHFHAVGDAAVREALDAITAAIEANGHRDRRHQVAHLNLIHPADLPRFAELGVTANYQALWAKWNEDRPGERTFLGEERFGRLIQINSMLQSGARIVLGSDWISESMNPLYSIQIAMTRQPVDGTAPAWNPDERISLDAAIEAYTINGAWLARQEQETGSIEVGKAADLIVLDNNLFDIDPSQIANVKVIMTMLEGDIVYRAGQESL